MEWQQPTIFCFPSANYVFCISQVINSTTKKWGQTRIMINDVQDHENVMRDKFWPCFHSFLSLECVCLILPWYASKCGPARNVGGLRVRGSIVLAELECEWFLHSVPRYRSLHCIKVVDVLCMRVWRSQQPSQFTDVKTTPPYEYTVLWRHQWVEYPLFWTRPWMQAVWEEEDLGGGNYDWGNLYTGLRVGGGNCESESEWVSKQVSEQEKDIGGKDREGDEVSL